MVSNPTNTRALLEDALSLNTVALKSTLASLRANGSLTEPAEGFILGHFDMMKKLARDILEIEIIAHAQSREMVAKAYAHIADQ